MKIVNRMNRMGGGYGMARGCFTNVLHSSQNYHQENATESRWVAKDVMAAWGAVILLSTELLISTSSNLWCGDAKIVGTD